MGPSAPVSFRGLHHTFPPVLGHVLHKSDGYRRHFGHLLLPSDLLGRTAGQPPHARPAGESAEEHLERRSRVPWRAWGALSGGWRLSVDAKLLREV
jgi:hypothetical protein